MAQRQFWRHTGGMLSEHGWRLSGRGRAATTSSVTNAAANVKTSLKGAARTNIQGVLGLARLARGCARCRAFVQVTCVRCVRCSVFACSVFGCVRQKSVLAEPPKLCSGVLGNMARLCFFCDRDQKAPSLNTCSAVLVCFCVRLGVKTVSVSRVRGHCSPDPGKRG